MMKRIVGLSVALSLILLTAMPVSSAPSTAGYSLPADRSIEAASAMLVYLGADESEDVVLFEQDADKKRSPGAMMHVMVGAAAMKIITEQGIDMSTRTATYTNECFQEISGTGLDNIKLTVGDRWTLRDLLSMCMIHTAADACVAIAYELSGGQAEFVDEMNRLARELGCKDSSFANVTGLDNIAQYMTAEDSVKLMRYAMKYPQLQDMMASEKYTGSNADTGDERTYLNTNEMTRKSSQRYNASVQFGKTGRSGVDGDCLVTVAQNSGYRYMTVVMGCPIQNSEGKTGRHFADTSELLSWAFGSFSYRSLVGKNEPKGTLNVNLAWERDTVQLVPQNGISAIVPKELDISSVRSKITVEPSMVNAPVTKGQVYGKIQLIIGVDQIIGEDNLVASESVSRSELLAILDVTVNVLTSPWFFAGLGTLLGLSAIYIVMNILHNRRRRKKALMKPRRKS